MLRIECLEGHCAGSTFEFAKDEIVFGREPDCDVFLNDSACPRHHARLTRDGEDFLIADLQSTNGVLVNGQRVEGSSSLRNGDQFTVGRNLFHFVCAGTASEDETADDPFIQNTITIQDAEKFFGSLGGPIRSLAPNEQKSASEERLKTEVAALQKASVQIRTAYKVSMAITSTLDEESLHDLITTNVLEHFADVEKVALFTKDRGTGRLRRVLSATRLQKEAPPFAISRSVIEKAVNERLGVLATDATSDSRFEQSKSIALMDLRSLMCVPLITRNIVIGALYAENSSVPGCFESSDLELLTIIGNQFAVALENAALFHEMQVSFYETVKGLGNALEAKDRYTRGHSDRVARYAEAVGKNLQLPDERVRMLRIAAELHDIGKIAIDESIISKAGKLTDEEFELMKQHPDLGVKILQPITFLQPVLPFIRHHHERLNGKGYPDGLKGEEIPLEARILNLVDAFDAMTTQRPYNEPKTFAEAIEQCRKESGISFDAHCVEAFARYVEELLLTEGKSIRMRPRRTVESTGTR